MDARTLVDDTQGLRFAESPRWHRDRWWFVDIHDLSIKSVGVGGDLRTEVALPFRPNALGFRSDGTVVFSDALNLTVYGWDGREVRPLADLHDLATFCLSDGFVDAHDRFYVGDIGYNFWDPANQPVDTCVITCVEPDGSARVVADGLCFPNGMVASADGTTLIVAETMRQQLTAFDIDADGGLSNRRVFASLPDDVHPDGIGLDAEGAVWLACPEARPTVRRVSEGGEVLETVDLDTHAYAVMLGGAERRQLLICASASHDPAQIAAAPTATLRVVEVQVPGDGRP